MKAMQYLARPLHSQDVISGDLGQYVLDGM
jgi:hypothetical protein